VLQSSVFDGLSFGPFALKQDGLAAPEVDVGWGEIVDALVITPVVVIGDERIDLGFEVAAQIVVLDQDAVLERLMPALDFPLRHRMIRRTASVLHVAVRAIRPGCWRRRMGLEHYRGLIQSGSLQGQFQRAGDFLGLHRGAELPGQ
jgi:hypothetical protein